MSIKTKIRKLDLVIPMGNPSILKVEARKLGVQGHLQLQTKFKSSLSYRRPYLKANNNIRVHIFSQLSEVRHAGRFPWKNDQRHGLNQRGQQFGKIQTF